MPKNIRKRKINNKDVSYLNRDFESFRNELIRYARVHYDQSVQDFSESSLAGLFTDMASYVGDVLSFYLDHQFSELSLETAVEENNVQRLIRQSGIEIVGASPSIAQLKIKIAIPASQNIDKEYIPNTNLIPKIMVGTVFGSTGGTSFELLEEIDFAETDSNGQLIADVDVNTTDSENNPTSFNLYRNADVTSATSHTETITISDQFVPFRQITLSKADINEIISIKDADGDEYYEVESLTQDTVYIRQKNELADFLSVPERIKMIPAPKRFERNFDGQSRLTQVRFGSGDENVFDEDVVPDPSEHAVRLYGDRKVVPFVTIDPNTFLSTSTLGISPRSTVLTIKYRYGGGINHNAAANQITVIKTLVTKFQDQTPTTNIVNIRASVTSKNLTAASGGENPPTLGELRQIALSSQNSQGRIVTKEDLLARVYSMPNKMGRIFRAGLRNNPYNPFASHLHVISRNSEGLLTFSSDSLKENLSDYLSNYRLITDGIDIVDARIINIGVNYSVTVDANETVDTVLQSVNSKLVEYFDIKNFHIDMPIIVSEIQNIIQNTIGVVSLLELDIVGKPFVEGSNSYSSVNYEPLRYTNRGILYPLPGGIFEVKFPNDDIKGRVK